MPVASEDKPASKSERTRSRILEAAAIVLQERGYAGARLDDIAKVAGIRSPAMYYYFDSREQLIEEVVTIGQQRVYDHVASALADAATSGPLERIGVAVRAQLEVTLRDSHHASAAMRISGHLPPEIRKRQLAEQRRYGDLWKQLLADAAAAGALTPGLDLSAARMLALGALNWVPEWWNARRGSFDHIVATAQTVVLNGLSGPP